MGAPTAPEPVDEVVPMRVEGVKDRAAYQREYRAKKARLRTPEGMREEAARLEDEARKLRRLAALTAGVLK